MNQLVLLATLFLIQSCPAFTLLKYSNSDCTGTPEEEVILPDNLCFDSIRFSCTDGAQVFNNTNCDGLPTSIYELNTCYPMPDGDSSEYQCPSTTTPSPAPPTQSSPYSTGYVLAVAIPLGIWGVSFLIAVGFCFVAGPKQGEFDNWEKSCCGTPLEKIRKLSIATWCFSILVWVTTWVALWCLMSYILSFITFVLAILIQHMASGKEDFIQTAVIANANGYKIGFIVLGVLLILNSIVAFVWSGVVMYSYVYYADEEDFEPFQFVTGMSVLAGLSMIITAACGMELGLSLVKVANAANVQKFNAQQQMNQTGGGQPLPPNQGQVLSPPPQPIPEAVFLQNSQNEDSKFYPDTQYTSPAPPVKRADLEVV